MREGGSFHAREHRRPRGPSRRRPVRHHREGPDGRARRGGHHQQLAGRTPTENYVLAVQDLAERQHRRRHRRHAPSRSTFVANRDVVISFTIETGEQYGFGVRENDDELQSALNEGLQAVQDNGTYAELTEEWFASE
ncbi:transporter substrate-binding domain-containing protein [Halobacterium sp. CBA1126]|uniref:transporter substrate-binding domain-containing protein n=1 Tax=Halobacterium sp. CBA1126 TaxID=2668074 RepID=UPI00374264C1